MSRDVSINEVREEPTRLPRLLRDGDRGRPDPEADGVGVRPAVDVDDPRVDLLDECRERPVSFRGREPDGAWDEHGRGGVRGRRRRAIVLEDFPRYAWAPSHTTK